MSPLNADAGASLRQAVEHPLFSRDDVGFESPRGCRFITRRNGIENRPGADRKTGNPQGTCEIRDVVCKTAFTQVGCVANQTEALSALWT